MPYARSNDPAKVMPHKYTGVQRCNQTKVEPQPVSRQWNILGSKTATEHRLNTLQPEFIYPTNPCKPLKTMVLLPSGRPRAEKGWGLDHSLPKASWNAQMHPISALTHPDPRVTPQTAAESCGDYPKPITPPQIYSGPIAHTGEARDSPVV
jgi:hypothetical protein